METFVFAKCTSEVDARSEYTRKRCGDFNLRCCVSRCQRSVKENAALASRVNTSAIFAQPPRWWLAVLGGAVGGRRSVLPRVTQVIPIGVEIVATLCESFSCGRLGRQARRGQAAQGPRREGGRRRLRRRGHEQVVARQQLATGCVELRGALRDRAPVGDVHPPRQRPSSNALSTNNVNTSEKYQFGKYQDHHYRVVRSAVP